MPHADPGAPEAGSPPPAESPAEGLPPDSQPGWNWSSTFPDQWPSRWPRPSAAGWPRHGPRSRLFRRLGCLFVLFNLLVAAIILLVVGWLAQFAGLIRLPQAFGHLLPWLFLLGFILFVVGFAVLIWAGHSLRRLTAPLGDLLDASERVAQGDYTVDVDEGGSREIRSLVQAFNAMASRLKVADEQRRSLLADVTHELRTLLTIIQGNLEAMLDGVYPADTAHLSSILEETQVLARLVDDLRTLSLSESGALRLQMEPTDLAVLVNEIVASFRSQADAAQVDLQVHIADDLPLLSLDPERMRQVLQNLIANALRYTPSGGAVAIRCQLGSPDDPRPVHITVQDSGSGIAPEDLPHIFDRFYKTRDSTGMGLGLPIARSLVAAHGGTILARNLPTHGALIEIALPLA